ncbi:MAG: hypothetical protein BHV65_00345 [Alistipes sp. 58_9_plus]|nr:MAG: hypothetical protein BHV65_00345 [Alistipes sp. 58_9_plus]
MPSGHYPAGGGYFNYDFGKGKNWPFQLTQNLNADMFSGYMHDPKPLQGGSHNSDYNLQDGWNSAMWQFTYSYVMPEIYRLEQTAAELMPPFYAIAKILKVLAMQRVTDYYGPVIYTHFGAQGAEYVPDGQQEVYMHFFDDLDEAVEILSDYVAERPMAGEFAKFDLLLDGSYAAWLRFANSLRMRLAVRLASVAPEKARAEFRKAAADPYGVIEVNTNNAAVKTSGIYSNPLGAINRSWNEAVMNASMESVLTGFGDPRIAKFFEPCAEDLVIANDGGESVSVPLKGQYHGVRQGTAFSHNYYAAFSRLTVEPTTEVVLMSAAEVWFLRAEAALRGWTDEDAGTCYRAGVFISFAQWQVSGAEQYLESDASAADYRDPIAPENDIAARCRVSPRWDESAAAEIGLERIITQKWIAMYPEGCEAWAEQRRTGYPRLFPVRFNHSKGQSIDTETMIRRLPYPATLETSDPEQYEMLLKELGGPDHGGTRLWWDTGRNF